MSAKTADQPWPKALLPLELHTARIITYSYDATVTNKEDAPSYNRISNHAYNLLTALASLREGDDTALVAAKQRSEQHLQDIVNSTRGIAFMGTPHQGSSLATVGKLLSRSVGIFKEANTDIVQVLKRDSEVLARIRDSFQALLMSRERDEATMIDIACFYEELPTKRYGVIVPKYSAILPGYPSIGIHRNHGDMTKFGSPDEPGFVAVCGELKRWMKRIQETESTSQNKSQSQCPVAHYLVPYTCNPDFVGRSEILELLKSQLGHSNPQLLDNAHRRAALHGLGGVGKTQIALAYAYWLQDLSKDISVFWVHASSGERFSEGFANIAKECKIPGHDDTTSNALKAVRDWLTSKESGKWLMIIDNADDMQLFFPSDEPHHSTCGDQDSLGQYIPDCTHGSVLITTRNMQAGSRLTKGKRPIEVDKMNDHESTQLLCQGIQQGDESLKDLLQLSSRLEFLPLALVQAAAFIQENSITVAEYLGLLDGNESDLIDLLREEFETVGRDSDTPHAVAQTWVLSFQQIERQYPFAGELLSLMSLFDRQAIPLEFLAFYGEEKNPPEPNIKMRLIKSLGVLKAFCFIRAEGGGNHNMHRLVQLVTRNWLTREDAMTEFARWALLAVSGFYPYGHFENIPTCTAYLAHAYTVLEPHELNSDEDRLVKASLLHRIGAYLAFGGRYGEAEKLRREATSIRMELLGEEHDGTLTIIPDLISSIARQGRWEEAEKMAVHLMETRMRLGGEEQPSTLDVMNNLAFIIANQDRSEEAGKLWSRVLEIRKRLLGEEHVDTIDAMRNLATVLEDEEAEELQRRTIKASKIALGDEHPGTLLSIGNLAVTLYNQGKLGKAEDLQVDVFETSKRVLGEEHPDTLTSMANLGQTWVTFGKAFADDRHLYPDVDLLGDAKKLLQDAVWLQSQLFGPDHPDTLQSRACLEECEEAMSSQSLC
ncbi:hypothetical protein F66182_2939 [Fusarium sp. NRRL 66182]|nr:hypothetical protein F66182_2939 [Fusarium sp. NRRL 66182]